MKLEQIKEESIRNNRFEAKVYNPIYLAILGFGGVFAFLLVIWLLLTQQLPEETPIAKYAFLFICFLLVTLF